eukprot:gene4981-5101_t
MHVPCFSLVVVYAAPRSKKKLVVDADLVLHTAFTIYFILDN